MHCGDFLSTSSQGGSGGGNVLIFRANINILQCMRGVDSGHRDG